MAKFRVVGISFDHMHMGDLLRQVHDHPEAEIAGIFDPDRRPHGRRHRAPSASRRTASSPIFDACMTATQPDLAILCAATADHARYTERLAAYGVHVFVEKPFAASVADARRDDRGDGADRQAAWPINWPLAWVERHVTAKRLIDDGHDRRADRDALLRRQPRPALSPRRQDRGLAGGGGAAEAHLLVVQARHSGGGSLLDYLGYGATLGTWYMNGEAPLEVTCTVDETPGIEVDQHSDHRLPLRAGPVEDGNPLGHLHRPLDDPAAAEMRLRLRRHRRHASRAATMPTTSPCRPARGPSRTRSRPIPCRQGGATPSNMCWAASRAASRITGPLDPDVSLIGQRIVDTAALSAREKRTLPLID